MKPSTAPLPARLSRLLMPWVLGLAALSLLGACASPVQQPKATHSGPALPTSQASYQVAPEPTPAPTQPPATAAPDSAPAAQTPPASPEPALWSGRLALTIESDPVQHFSASFELRGNAASGSLSLSSPLGQRLALAQWDAQQALLQLNGRSAAYASMDELSAALTGVALPLPALFAWLHGQAAEIEGWQADLSRHAQGRLQARRWQPGPPVELRLVLH